MHGTIAGELCKQWSVLIGALVPKLWALLESNRLWFIKMIFWLLPFVFESSELSSLSRPSANHKTANFSVEERLNEASKVRIFTEESPA